MRKITALMIVGLVAHVASAAPCIDGGAITVDSMTFIAGGSITGTPSYSGGGASLSGMTLGMRTGDWEGDEVGLGSTTNNAVVWDGYSTANATNNTLSGDAWYSAAGNIIQDKYYFGFIPAPPTASRIGSNGIAFQVRASNTNIANAYINVLIGDTSGTITNIASMRGTSANEWKTYSLPGSNLPSAWTSAVPSWVEDGITVRGLDLRADAFLWKSNNIQCKSFVDWD